MNPLIQVHSGTTLEMSLNAFSTNQGTNEDDSQSDPHPEAGIFGKQAMQNSGPEDDPYMVTGATKRHDMVTGVQRESLWQRDMVTGVHEEVTYCSPSTSSGKQKNNRSTSQPQFCNENTSATIEADPILVALQQLANINNCASFHNNFSRIFNFPKSLTTTMPTFDGKSEKFELFEDLFQTRLKLHNHLTEENRINYFQSFMKGDALQTFKNINGPTRENLGKILAIFRRKYVKPHSMARAKHKFQKFVVNTANWKLVDFLDELQKLAKDAFGIAAHAIIEQFINVNMPPHLNKSINQAHLENGTYKQIVTPLERELELNGLEATDELQINTVSHNTTNTKADRPKPTCHHCKKPRLYRNQCRLREKTARTNWKYSKYYWKQKQCAKNSNPNNSVNINNHNNYKNSNRTERKPETVYPPCETFGKTNHSAERCYVGANAANKPHPWQSKPEGQSGHHQQDAQNIITGCVLITIWKLNQKGRIFTPELLVTDRRPPEENYSNPSCCLAATSGDIRGQFKLANNLTYSTAETNQNKHSYELN